MESLEKIEQAQSIMNIQKMVPSNYISRYTQSLWTSEQQMLKLKLNLTSQLHQKRMINEKGGEGFQLSLVLIENSPQFQSIVLKAFYGRFQMILSILFSDDRSSTHQIFTRFGGNFATVYKASILKRQVAIKCTHFNNKNFIEIFEDTIKEYIIFKVLSQLKLGPKVQRYLGFDIVIGFDCIQFCTEFCQHQLQKSSLPTVSKDLKQILLKLHSLNIIHGDIKTDNICYSNIHKKFVFIDYGLHCISSQPLGQKSWTSFKGTVSYVLPQMEECLSMQKHQFIDLYYNDLYGLLKTLNEIEKGSNLSHRGRQAMETDITKKVAKSLMKGVIAEKYLISQFIIEGDYYKKLTKYFSQNFEFNKREINCFEKTLRDRIQSGILPCRQSKVLLNIDEFGFDEKEDEFDFFKNQSFLIVVDKIKQILCLNPFDRDLLVQDGLYCMDERDNLKNQQFISKLDESKYFQLISKYISMFQGQQTFNICKFMLESRFKIKCSNLLQHQVLGRGYSYLINYSLDNKLSNHRFFYIFKYSMVSSIIFEIFSEQQLKNIMENSLSLQINLIRKCRLLLVFIEGLQWVKSRIQSRYRINKLLSFLHQKLQLLLESCNKTNLRKQELNLIKCMKMLLMPSVEPSKLIQILKAIHNRLHFYYFSTNECESAFIEVLMVLAITSEIQGEKQFMIYKVSLILSRLKQMKHYEKKKKYIVSDILFAKRGDYFKSHSKNKIIMEAFLRKRRFIKYFSKKKGQQKYTTIIFDFINNSIYNEYRREDNLRLENDQLQRVNTFYHYKQSNKTIKLLLGLKGQFGYQAPKQIKLQPKPSGLTISEQRYSKENAIEFHNDMEEDLQEESQQYNYSKIKQEIIISSSSQKFCQLLSYFYELIKRAEKYYHRHQLPFHIQAIMNLIKFYQQKDDQQNLQIQYLSVLEEILSIINNSSCIICKLFSYSFFNLQRYFIKPKTSLSFIEYQEYLISIILSMAKLVPFTQLFAKFLFEVLQTIKKIYQDLSQTFNYQFALLIYEICKAINSYELIFTINRGSFDTLLLKQLFKYFWDSNRKEDYFYLIKKVYQYIKKSNCQGANKYFMKQILKYRYSLAEQAQLISFELTEDNHFKQSKQIKHQIQFEQFCQEHIKEFMQKASLQYSQVNQISLFQEITEEYLYKKSLGIYTMIMVSAPYHRCKRNNNYFFFSWLNYKQYQGDCTSWKIYNQYIEQNQKKIPKRKMRFLEKKMIFAFFGEQVRKYQQNPKSIELRIVKMIGKNHLAHWQRNKQLVKNIRKMQVKSSLPEMEQQTYNNNLEIGNVY